MAVVRLVCGDERVALVSNVLLSQTRLLATIDRGLLLGILL